MAKVNGNLGGVVNTLTTEQKISDSGDRVARIGYQITAGGETVTVFGKGDTRRVLKTFIDGDDKTEKINTLFDTGKLRVGKDTIKLDRVSLVYEDETDAE